MKKLIHTLYGDGTRSVVVTDEQVIVREQYSDVDDAPSYRTIAFSHAAWREITLGWQRFQQEEDT